MKEIPPHPRAPRDDASPLPVWEPGERPLFAVTLFAAAAVLAVLAWPMLLGLVYPLDDLGNMHLPMRHFYARCLADGVNPVWNPHIWCGYYLHGQGEVGMYHPLHWFLYRPLGVADAFNLELFLSYPALLAGTYFFLRRRAMRRDAALFGGMLFTLSGFALLHFIHMNMVAVTAHMPWLLLAVEASLWAPTRRRRSLARLAVSLLTASALLLGHAQAAWFAALAAVLWLAYLRAWRTPARLAFVVSWAAAGALIAAVQIIPNFDALVHSDRWHSASYTPYSLSLPPANLVQLVAPYLLGGRIVPDEAAASAHEYGIYGGAVALVLVVWLAANVRRLQAGHRRLAWAAFAVASAAIVVMLGKYACVYALLARVPLVGTFRAPVRYVVFLHFALSISGALAFETLARASSKGRAWPAILPAVLSIAVAAAAAAGAFGTTQIGRFLSADARLVWLGPLLFALCALALYAAARGLRGALAALVLLAAADLGAYGLSYIRSAPPLPLPALVDSVRGFPEPQGFWRTEAYPTTDNLPVLKGYRLVTGYIGLTPAKSLSYTQPLPLRLASCHYRILKTSGPGPSGEDVGRLSIEPVPSPMPRARLISNAVVSRDPAADLASVDVASTALVPRELALPPSEPGSVYVKTDRPGEITVLTSVPARRLLVISESYHKGWKARSNGRVAEVLPVYGDFLGVVVEPAMGEITLTFDPDSLRIGRTVALVGLALTLAFTLLSLFPPHPATGAPGACPRS